MIIAKLRTWQELSYTEKRRAYITESKGYYDGLKGIKEKSYFLANFLHPYYYDESGQLVYVFNSIVKN